MRLCEAFDYSFTCISCNISWFVRKELEAFIIQIVDGRINQVVKETIVPMLSRIVSPLLSYLCAQMMMHTYILVSIKGLHISGCTLVCTSAYVMNSINRHMFMCISTSPYIGNNLLTDTCMCQRVCNVPVGLKALILTQLWRLMNLSKYFSCVVFKNKLSAIHFYLLSFVPLFAWNIYTSILGRELSYLSLVMVWLFTMSYD